MRPVLMVLVALGLLALGSCAGAAHRDHAPAPCPPAPARECPPGPSQPASQPVTEPARPSVPSEPASQPVTEPARQPDHLDPKAWPAGTAGWYCMEIRRKRGDRVYRSRCTRTKRSCADMLAASLEVKAPGYFSPCRRHPSAFCFLLHDPFEKYVELNCRRTYVECVSAWGDSHKYYGSSPDVTHTMCEEIK